MVEPSSSLNRAIVTNSTGLPLEAFFFLSFATVLTNNAQRNSKNL